MEFGYVSEAFGTWKVRRTSATRTFMSSHSGCFPLPWTRPSAKGQHQAPRVQSGKRDLVRAGAATASSRIELVNPPASDVLDQHKHGPARGATLPSQGCPGRRNQVRHDHHRCRSLRFDHPKHPHQAELWFHGRLHQVRWHHCRLRYIDLLDYYPRLS
jgi:hypothetical protein